MQTQSEYVSPEQVELVRDEGAQLAAGISDRLTMDQGGHLVAASLGGPGEGINLVAMAKELNGAGRNNWWAMEHDWRKALKADPNVDIRVTIDVDYAPGSNRPETFAVEYSISGGRAIRRDFDQ